MTGTAPKRLNTLKEAFGNEIELVGEEGEVQSYVIKVEFQLGETSYAALQSEAMRKEDEVELFRVILSGHEEPQLETIEDDDEWEAASEAYDDMLFANDERP